ncbi:hypothetical protein [Stutzerimonas kunmingensis]|uniref:hypothetical protein n=1 Tax=Stutzerimonas kunmingensis TaxID=1211807 RepID=UPI0028A763F9|nr:hypothetical protein [Stutzerimonas kunmingensis]
MGGYLAKQLKVWAAIVMRDEDKWQSKVCTYDRAAGRGMLVAHHFVYSAYQQIYPEKQNPANSCGVLCGRSGDMAARLSRALQGCEVRCWI